MTSPLDQQWLIPDFEKIPDDLKNLPWAVWIAEPRINAQGKFNKAPRNPRTGIKIGANKPESFGTFEEAKAAYKTGKYTGVGVLLTGNGVVGVDIDNCRDTFSKNLEIKLWVANAIIAGAYAELSPSKTGVRLFILGKLPEKGRKYGSLEIYDNQRFLTVTGNHITFKGAADVQ